MSAGLYWMLAAIIFILHTLYQNIAILRCVLILEFCGNMKISTFELCCQPAQLSSFIDQVTKA